MHSPEQRQPLHETHGAGEKPPTLPKVMVGYEGEDPPYLSGGIRAKIAGIQSACMISVQSASDLQDGIEVFSGVVVGVTARKEEERPVLLNAVYRELENRGFNCASGHERVRVIQWPGPHFFVQGSDQYPSGVLKDMVVRSVEEIERTGIETEEKPLATAAPKAPNPQPKPDTTRTETTNFADLKFSETPTPAAEELRVKMAEVLRQELQEKSLPANQRFQLMNRLMTDISILFGTTATPASGASGEIFDDNFDLEMKTESKPDPTVDETRRKVVLAFSSVIEKHDISYDDSLLITRSLMAELSKIFSQKGAA